MGYLDDVVAHLATRRAGSGLHQDPRNALWDILQGKLETAAPDNAAWHSSVGSGTSIGDVAKGAWNAVGSAIDFVERPLYAGMGAMEETAKQGGVPTSPFANVPLFIASTLRAKNKGAIGEAFWKGLSGQEHKTFGDVTTEVAKHPGLLGDLTRMENQNPLGKFAMNMTGDVALDPLTYVGTGAVGAVGRGIARPAFGAVGKELPKILEKGGLKASLRTKNPVKQFKDAATPEQVAVDSLDTTGVAKVNSTVSDKAVAKFNEPQLPGFEPGTLTPEAESNVAKLTARTKPLSLQPGHGILAPPTGKAAERISTAQAALAAHRTKAATILAPFEHARYAPDLEVTPFHMTEPGVPKKVLQEVEKTREIPIGGTPAQEVKKSIGTMLHPATYDESTKSYMALDHQGNPLSIGGVDVNIPAQHLHDLAMKGGELSAVEKKAHLQLADGKTVPAAKVVKMLQDQAETAKLVGKQTRKEKYMAKEVVEQPTTRRRKLSRFERLVWELQAEKVLHPEDVATLKQAGMKSFKQFDEALAAVRNKVDTTEYKSLDELAAAVTDGTAPKAVTDELKKRLGRGKLETLIKNLKAAEEKVAGQAGKAREAEAKAYAKTPASKYEAKNGLPSPEGNPETIVEAANVAEKATAAGVPPKVSLAEKVSIDAWQSETVTNAVRNSFKSEFGDPATWKNMSKAGAKKEAPGYYEKRARWIEGFNKRSSIGVVKDIMGAVTKRLEGMPGGKVYTAAKYDTAMPMLRASEQVMRKEGIQPILGGGYKGRGIPMSMHDILESLPRDFVEKYMFDKPWKGQSWNFAPTQLADIAEQFVHLHLGNKDLPAVEAAVREILKKPLNKAGYKAPITQKLERVGKDGKDRYEPTVAAVMDAFTKATPNLGKRLTENIAQTAVDEHGVAKALTDESIAAYSAVVSDPRFSPGSHIQAALDRHKFVDEAARAANVNPASAGVDLAHQSMDAHIAETFPIGTAKTIEKSTAQLGAATTKNEAVHAAVTVAKGAQDEATAQILRDGDNYIDFGNQAELGLALGWAHRMIPDAGSENVHRDLLNFISTAQTYVKDHANTLAQLHQKYPPATGELEQAWNQLKSWEPGQLSTPAMDDLMVAIKDAIEVVPGGKFGWFTRNVKDHNLLMEDYDHFGVRQHHGDITLDPNDLENSWRSWEPGEKGILDLISRVNASHTYAVAKHTMGSDFTARFSYDKAGPGLVKIVDNKGTSEIAKYIDTSKWYSEDHVRQLHMLDETMKELKAGSPGGKLGRKLRNLDIATQMFKAGVTIYRPGHHTRNAVGDIWLASMDGVTPKYYARSSKILLANRAKDHSFDALRSLAPVGGPDRVGNVLSLTYKGETRHFTEAQVYQMMKNAGGLPTFDIIEDVSLKSTELDPRLATGIIGQVQKRAHLPGALEGKAHKVATGVSENREHWIRIAHWLHAMENAPLRGKTFDEAVRNATFDSVSRVRKWHPDGSDLTKVERTYMRRIIPFYSWIRKAIPLVIETAIQKPGKVMLYPKAMYDWAEAQGIDLQSYGNPFPADQQFPSWIADQTQGPQWGFSGAYAGLNPGVPSADVADQYLANPGQLKNTILGSLNPLARIPIEVATGTKLRTGGPIGDRSDYIDQQLPMGSYIDRLAGGRSLSTGFTQPNYEAPSNVGFENPSVPPGTGFLNWLTGAGITDFSKPSYTKFAQLEQKKAARG